MSDDGIKYMVVPDPGEKPNLIQHVLGTLLRTETHKKRYTKAFPTVWPWTRRMMTSLHVPIVGSNVRIGKSRGIQVGA